MRWGILSVVLAGALAALGQTTPPPAPATAPETTFRTGSQLVLVPAVVTGKAGHVSGLKPEDFVVEENGRPQKIAVFEEITSVGSASRPQLPPGVFTNQLALRGPAPLITIFVLDRINTPLFDQEYGRKQLLAYLSDKLQPNMLVCLAYADHAGVHVIHDFTGDTSALIRALKAVCGQQPAQPVDAQLTAAVGDFLAGRRTMLPSSKQSPDTPSADAADHLRKIAELNEEMYVRNDSVEATFLSLLALAQAFNGVPGRKTMVWITAGFPFHVADIEHDPSAQNKDLAARTYQALNDANIAIYPVDARGLMALSQASPRSRVSSAQFGGDFAPPGISGQLGSLRDSIGTLQDVAALTGGRAYYNRNDLDHGIALAVDDSSSYYMLGYYLPAEDAKPGWRKLKVEVTKPGAHVRARDGFFVTAEPGERTRDAELMVALASPLDAPAIPLAVKMSPAETKDGKRYVEWRMAIDAKGISIDPQTRHVIIEVLSQVRDAKTGAVAARFGRTVSLTLKEAAVAGFHQSALAVNAAFQLPAGEYNARFVVMDQITGQVGSLNAHFDVP